MTFFVGIERVSTLSRIKWIPRNICLQYFGKRGVLFFNPGQECLEKFPFFTNVNITSMRKQPLM